jgi:tyrosinase
MKRRDFLKGGAGLIAAGASSRPAVAQEFVSPRALELIRIHWCYGQPRLRRNFYTLYNSNPNHPIIQAYKQGVTVMKSRPVNDPTSWEYQANIHASNVASGWPAGAPWSTCQHGTVHFLSWHRMYLYFFERILTAAAGNPPDFALPYWDYSSPGQASLPPPFRVPNNNTNVLWASRNASVNTGSALPASAVGLGAMTNTPFTSFQGALEGTPHASVHMAVGGGMGNFVGAGRDPIFWLHHCNIDRLWEKWLTAAGHVNPTSDSTWMNTNFKFVDENKNFVQMSGDDVLYTVNQLHYQYEDPRTCVPPWWYYLLASEKIIFASLKARTLASVVLARNIKPTPDQARLDLRIEDGDTRERLAKILSFETLSKTVEGGARYSLLFEGVQTDAPLDGYFEVYLGLPRDGKPDPNGPYYVGNLAPFGADAESRHSHGQHSDFGLPFALDVTEPLKRLVERGDLKNEITVTLVPAGVAKSPGERFAFDAKANPRIDAAVLKIEKDE